MKLREEKILFTHQASWISSFSTCSRSFNHVRLCRRVCSPSVGTVPVIQINDVDNFSSVQQLNKFVIHLLLHHEWTPLYVYELDSFHNGTNMPYHAMFMCLGSTTPIRLTILDYLR
uniref:Uncharacterized protein n=1 Tax=Oryza rufipogon TaxID=4529 RepID=A0A0E0R6M3_ORYRU